MVCTADMRNGLVDHFSSTHVFAVLAGSDYGNVISVMICCGGCSNRCVSFSSRRMRHFDDFSMLAWSPAGG